jgi:ribose/xylose/arabinose/galactoside ABC-type transport system permease subunit
MVSKSEVQPATTSAGTESVVLRVASRVWAWLFLLILIGFFSTLARGFFTPRTFQNILVNSSETLIVALGQTFVIISGGIDLSVGMTMGLVTVVAAVVMKAMNIAQYPPALILLAGLVSGTAIGLVPGIINGLVIAKLKAPPFIATLGMYGVAKCVAFLLSEGQTVGRQPDILGQLGNNYLIYVSPNQPLTFFNPPAGADLRVTMGLLTIPLLVMIATAAICHFILSQTRFGQHTYAVGGSPAAALRAGINVDLHTIKLYVVCALLAAVSGLVWAARYNSGSPIAGDALMLNTVAAVVIGGASLSGGEGTVLGTVVGSLIMAVLYTGLVMLNVPPFWQFGAVGIIIIIAVLVDQARMGITRK